jgi:hypothetical protein
MFSIINTESIKALIWHVPAPGATSFAPPARVARDLPAPSLLIPYLLPPPRAQPTSPMAPESSHTSASSAARESSHTQEFTAATRGRRRD